MDLKHSEYIVYVDESGDHSLESINPRYPLFVLCFCIFQKRYYSHVVTPMLRMLKFATFGHDMVVLHEHDIRKKIGAFSKLGRQPREDFLNALTNIIDQTDFILIPIVIDKCAIRDLGIDPVHIYHLAMQLGLEKLQEVFLGFQQEDFHTHIVFEARGKKEDIELEVEFQRVCSGSNSKQQLLPFEIVIADKKVNSEGLQFADMVARPIGLSVLKPDQANRAASVLQKKIYQEHESLVFPLKAKGLKEVLEALTPVG